MDYQEILIAIRLLPIEEQCKLIVELTKISFNEDYKTIRQDKLSNKQIGCPHCNSLKYYKYGKDKGSAPAERVECRRGRPPPPNPEPGTAGPPLEKATRKETPPCPVRRTSAASVRWPGAGPRQ